jgi:hypothetical protein
MNKRLNTLNKENQEFHRIVGSFAAVLSFTGIHANDNTAEIMCVVRVERNTLKVNMISTHPLKLAVVLSGF